MTLAQSIGLPDFSGLHPPSAGVKRSKFNRKVKKNP